MKVSKNNILVEKSKFVNEDLCKRCKGRCCKNMGCHFAPDDFKDLSYEGLKKEIEKGFISIDWWEGNPFNEDDDSISEAYYLRMRNKGADIVDPAFISNECILLTDKGCPLKFEERPKGARLLIPSEGECLSKYTKQESAQEWFKYNNILWKLKIHFIFK